MATSESTSAHATSRLRRYSVRTPLIAASLLGVALGWLGIEFRQQREERRLGAMCIQLGASVKYTGEEGGRITELHFFDETDPNDDQVRQLARLSRLQTLWLSQSKVTGRGIEVLVKFPALRELHVNRAQLSDGGMQHLKQLSQFEQLTGWGLQYDDCRGDELKLAMLGCKVGW